MLRYAMFDTPQFADRHDAAMQLAGLLTAYRGRHPLVLAIPRGAVPMAHIIAQQIDGELDVVLAHKLGAPYSPEFAIGAVTESGWTWLPPETRTMGISAEYIEEEKSQQLAALKRKREQYTPLKPPADPHGRVVIVVDDGLATGATMIAALHALREQHPAELVCAVPVAAPDSLEKVRKLADAVACVHAPPHFRAVGQFYRNFPQVEDEEVERILKSALPKS